MPSSIRNEITQTIFDAISPCSLAPFSLLFTRRNSLEMCAGRPPLLVIPSVSTLRHQFFIVFSTPHNTRFLPEEHDYSEYSRRPLLDSSYFFRQFSLFRGHRVFWWVCFVAVSILSSSTSEWKRIEKRKGVMKSENRNQEVHEVCFSEDNWTKLRIERLQSLSKKWCSLRFRYFSAWHSQLHAFRGGSQNPWTVCCSLELLIESATVTTINLLSAASKLNG